MILDSLAGVLTSNALIVAFVFVGLLVWFSYWLSQRLTSGRIHGSAVAITLDVTPSSTPNRRSDHTVDAVLVRIHAIATR